MILDARSLAAAGAADSDVCIIGAGAAGITLALEMEATGLRVTLIEAGGLQFDPAAQRLMEGETAGDDYPPLRDTRLAGLGGTTEVYAGYLRALDARRFHRLALPARHSGSLLSPCARALRPAALR